MKNDETNSFSFETLCFVTGFSAFGFLTIMKILDGDYHSIFTWVGISGLTLGVLSKVIKLLLKPVRKKHSPVS